MPAIHLPRPRIVAAIAICVLITASAPLAAQPTSLRYRFVQGTSYTYKRTERTDATSETQTGLRARIDRTSEAFMRVAVEESSPSAITFTFVQDTALVDDRSPASPNSQNAPDFDNLLTKKPVRVTMDPLGVLRRAEPLVPITAGRTLPPGMSDASIARQAMIFPLLPERALTVGMTWKDSTADTTHPVTTTPDYGEGKGLRHVRIVTTYTVTGIEQVGTRSCWRIAWEGTTFIESKMIFASREYFTEETTASSGALWFAPDEGIPVKLTLSTHKSGTTAAYADEVAIIPSTTNKDITLQLSPL